MHIQCLIGNKNTLQIQVQCMTAPLSCRDDDNGRRMTGRLWQLTLGNNLSIMGIVAMNNCIVIPPLLANYNLEWYHYNKRPVQMLRGQF